MARLFHASFDHIPAQQLQPLGLWAFVGPGIVTTTGRTGDGVTGTAGASADANTLRTQALGPASATQAYLGFALNCVTLPLAERQVWAVLDNAGATLIALTVAPDGTVSVFRGAFAGGVRVGTSATAFAAAGAFRYLQVGFDFDADVVLVLSTVAGGATSLLATTPGLSSPLPWAAVAWSLDETLILDDVYVNDTSGANAYFSGDTTIATLTPTAAVFHTFFYPWTPNSGSSLPAPVADPTYDGDATHLYTRESYATLRFDLDALTDDGRPVDDVKVIAVARAVSSAWLPALLINWRRWDGIVLEGLFPQPMSTVYRAFHTMTQASGAIGGHAWTIARVNASDFGVRS